MQPHTEANKTAPAEIHNSPAAACAHRHHRRYNTHVSRGYVRAVGARVHNIFRGLARKRGRQPGPRVESISTCTQGTTLCVKRARGGTSLHTKNGFPREEGQKKTQNISHSSGGVAAPEAGGRWCARGGMREEREIGRCQGGLPRGSFFFSVSGWIIMLEVVVILGFSSARFLFLEEVSRDFSEYNLVRSIHWMPVRMLLRVVFVEFFVGTRGGCSRQSITNVWIDSGVRLEWIFGLFRYSEC